MATGLEQSDRHAPGQAATMGGPAGVCNGLSRNLN